MTGPDGHSPDYVLRPPGAAAVPLMVSIPHTGTAVPPGIARRFTSPAMAGLPMTDWHLHRLYDFLPGLGVTLLHATWSRFVVDLNRPPDQRPLYPGRFETGLVPTETFQGEAIFDAPPDAAEVERLRRRYHAPYHAALAATLDSLRARFGRAVLVDAHSVASVPSRLHGRLEQDIYLGDRDGATCGPWLRDTLTEGFTAAGLDVAHNRPYKGGYTTDHYGRLEGVQAIQIEMCQRVYMDESDPAGGPDHHRFAEARGVLQACFERLLARPELAG